jgi:hypothetical protein
MWNNCAHHFVNPIAKVHPNGDNVWPITFHFSIDFPFLVSHALFIGQNLVITFPNKY